MKSLISFILLTILFLPLVNAEYRTISYAHIIDDSNNKICEEQRIQYFYDKFDSFANGVLNDESISEFKNMFFPIEGIQTISNSFAAMSIGSPGANIVLLREERVIIQISNPDFSTWNSAHSSQAVGYDVSITFYNHSYNSVNKSYNITQKSYNFSYPVTNGSLAFDVTHMDLFLIKRCATFSSLNPLDIYSEGSYDFFGEISYTVKTETAIACEGEFPELVDTLKDLKSKKTFSKILYDLVEIIYTLWLWVYWIIQIAVLIAIFVAFIWVLFWIYFLIKKWIL